MIPLDRFAPTRADLLPGLLALGVVASSLAFGGITRTADLALHLLAAAVLLALAGTQRQRPPVVTALVVAIVAVALPHALAALLDQDPFATALAAPDLERSPWAPTLRGALAWIRFALLLWAAELVLRHRRSRRIAALGVAAAAALQVVYGAPRWIGNIAPIWGIEVPGDASRLRGTFVNPDHLGQFLAIGLAVVFASTWAIARNTRFESFDRRIVANVLPLLLWTTLFVAVAFTGSRGALLAVLAATLVQGVAIGRGPLWRRFSGAALLAFGVASVAWIGLRQGLGRVLATSAWDLEWNARVAAAQSGFELWLRSPWLGVGIGGFREAFPSIQPATLPGSWRHVHNNWLELLIVCGALGVLVLLVGFAGTLRVALRSRSWPERSEDRAALVAALGAATAVGVHEAFDFGLTMPANTWTAAVVIGAGLAALGKRRDSAAVELAEGDEVFDRDQQEPVGAGENLEVAEAGHGAVVLHNLADHPGGGQPRKPR